MAHFFVEDCEAKATSLKEDRLRIEHFNVERVLVCGSCLLGSHGAEYDVDDNVGRSISKMTFELSEELGRVIRPQMDSCKHRQMVRQCALTFK